MNFFKILNKGKDVTLNLAVNKSCAVLCTLSNAQINNAFANYSLKLTLKGEVIYKVNNNTFWLAQDEYLISTGEQDGKGYVDSQDEVDQFCVHLIPATIADMYNVISSSRNYDFEGSPNTATPYFFENVYNLGNSLPISNFLQPIASQIKKGKKSEVYINEEWLLNLSELIVLNEMKLRWAETGLQAVKKSTRDEILRRLVSSKDYMDNYFTKDPTISEISRIARMSEGLFYRCFKQAFRITPYQYILHKKLELSERLVVKTKMRLDDIAISAGFPDLSTFSKAFKRKFHCAPSQIRK